MPHFNPRSPCGERPLIARCTVPENHFNPRSPCGERRVGWFCEGLDWRFQSTLPVRGATVPPPLQADPPTLGISIHAPRAGSDATIHWRVDVRDFISIHAPRAGSDASPRVNTLAPSRISIHAPRAGSDAYLPPIRDKGAEFQSTLPVRGATATAIKSQATILFQSTLPVRGATGQLLQGPAPHRIISIHAPRAGSDSVSQYSPANARISIHAPRAGSDSEDAQNGTVYFEQLS